MWHPFTQQQQWVAEEPLIVERAHGCWLYTTFGGRLLDGNSSLWVDLAEACLHHPFVQGIARGDLPRDQFVFYVE